MNRFKKKKSQVKSIALERIAELFKQADLAFSKHPERSNKYVAFALKISSRTKTKLPRELKRRVCKHCKSYLVPGKNARIRLNKGKKTYFCMVCGKFTRVPYK